MDLNRVVLIGRLVRDPELRTLPSGTAKAEFTLAVHRPPGTDGERQTDFIECVAWRRQAETLAEHARKGETLAVEGRLQVRSYTTEDGTRRRVTEISLTDFSFGRDRRPAQEEQQRNASSLSRGQRRSSKRQATARGESGGGR